MNFETIATLRLKEARIIVAYRKLLRAGESLHFHGKNKIKYVRMLTTNRRGI